MANEREARIGYEYDDDGRGPLTDNHIGILVDPMGQSPIPLRICHPNYLHCNFIDCPRRIHQGTFRFKKSLTDYIQCLNRGGIHPVMHYRIPNDPASCNYIPEEYRSIIRSMINFIVYIHSLNLSLVDSPLDANTHFVVVKEVVDAKDEVKFWKVNFRASINRHIRARDFFLISEVIRRDVLGGRENAQLPYDMAHLLQGMASYQEWYRGKTHKDGTLFSRHMAILSHAERTKFMMDCRNKRLLFLPRGWQQFYDAALWGIGDVSLWSNRFRPDSRLVIFGPILENINESCPEHPGAGTHEAADYLSNHYKDTEYDRYVVNRKLLSFCRNLATHLPQSCQYFLYKFGDKDIDIMISHVFGEELVRFQVGLHRQEILCHFIA